MSFSKDDIRKIVTDVVRERTGAGPTASPAHAEPAPVDRDRGDDRIHRGRDLITEKDVMEAHRQKRDLIVRPGTLLTPLARDAVERYGVNVREGAGNADSVANVKNAATGAGERSCDKGAVAIASDHGGFEMKQFLVKFLEEEAGIPCEDLGTHSADAVDYPDFARKVADSVAAGDCCRGIVVDGAGIGSAMAANKVRGVRAAHCSNVVEARNAREHNDANVLSLGGRMIGPELAKAIVVVFLKTDFGGGRHQGRVDKIMDIER